jgi:hypothetical protein
MRAPRPLIAASLCLIALPALAAVLPGRMPAQGTAPVPASQVQRAGSVGVVYAARGSGAFGMAIGESDRLAAHREAERQCAMAGTGCRVVAEFTAACGAAAQGVQRSNWALFVSNDPNSYEVTSVTVGTGATQRRAEQAALASCRSKDPSANCFLLASACAGRD